MDLGEVSLNEGGSWRGSVYPARAAHLLAALDPTAGFVVIETYDGVNGWHESIVSVSPDEEPRRRLVRHHSFELLVDPVEAAEIGRHLSASGRGFMAYQFRDRPPAQFDLPEHPKGRAEAMRGQGVVLAIDLPHDGELAVVASPSKDAVDEFLLRLA